MIKKINSEACKNEIKKLFSVKGNYTDMTYTVYYQKKEGF